LVVAAAAEELESFGGQDGGRGHAEGLGPELAVEAVSGRGLTLTVVRDEPLVEALQRLGAVRRAEHVLRRVVASDPRELRGVFDCAHGHGAFERFKQAAKRIGLGVLSLTLFFSDVLSDFGVCVKLYQTDNPRWATTAALLLVGQYVVVYLRALAYLETTHGKDSEIYTRFRCFGFPMGVISLDLLMLVEPFGLLGQLPLPEWLRQFVPAFKATRIITEVFCESLPQCLLQSSIFAIVVHRTTGLSLFFGTASDADRALAQNAAVLPMSIAISLVAILKTWIVDIVIESRKKGSTPAKEIARLYNMGQGLAIDAIKRGGLIEWACPRAVEAEEVGGLLDALSANSTITSLDLSKSELGWDATLVILRYPFRLALTVSFN